MRKLATLLIAVSTFALAGCGGSSATGGKSPHEQLVAAKKSFDAARSIQFSLAASSLPDGVDEGLYSASGTGTHAPAFTGKVKAKAGITLDVDVVAIDGKVYAKLPFAGWTGIDVAKYGAPNPAALMDKSTGLSSLLTDLQHPEQGKQTRQGSTVLSAISGTIAGRDMHAVFPTAGRQTFRATFKLDSHQHLRAADISGPFYAGHPSMTYALTVKLSSSKVEVKAP